MSEARTRHEFDRQQARHQGLGTADTTRKEWPATIYRDSFASLVGHKPVLTCLSVAYGEPMNRTKRLLLDEMLVPKIVLSQKGIPKPQSS